MRHLFFASQPLMSPAMRSLLTLLILLLAPYQIVADERPNIIYIMSDDMGYSDIGCYGSEIETPNLDGLAANGLRFTQFYNMSRCCPTRASLLTGLYPHQAGIGHMMEDSGQDGYRGELNRNSVTIAEVLQTAGYRTYMSGKWHVTQHVNPKDASEQQNWPRQRGFDRFYGTIHGAGSFYDPNSLARDNQLISPFADPEYQPAGSFFYTNAISDQAVRFVREHHQDHSGQPFFMYVSFTAAHWPMHAPEEDIDKYRGKYDVGYDAIRSARYEKMVQLGVINRSSTSNWPIDDSTRETENLAWDNRNMEVYAAMIDRMDRGVGQIVASLEETGQLKNTLLLFFQDNGGCAEGYGRNGEGQTRAEMPTLEPLPSEFLQRDMQPKQTRDGYPVRTGKGVMAGPADTYIGYGKAWATVSNTPFREYKHWVHEGGISTPLIAHWPVKITRRGELEHTPGHLVDLMTTAVELAQANYPRTFHNGQAIQPMEGKSLLPAFNGTGLQREAIYWEHEGNRAVRMGDFKLVAKSATGDWELYNIAADRSEQNNLASQQPERVQDMAQKWQSYAERAKVLPLTPYYKKNNDKFKTNKLKFGLKQTDDLDRNSAPFVVGRGIEFSADLSETTDGVLIAQGGVTHGWGLYFKAGKINWAITRAGMRTIIASDQPIAGAGHLLASMDLQGKVSLQWNGKVVAAGTVPGLLKEQPADGLQVGCDLLGNVGDYTSPNRYKGQISNALVKLQIDKSAK